MTVHHEEVRLTRDARGDWVLRHGGRTRYAWNGAWPPRAVLALAAATLTSRDGRAVGWRRTRLPGGGALYRPVPRTR